jgi:hypothetical protein
MKKEIVEREPISYLSGWCDGKLSKIPKSMGAGALTNDRFAMTLQEEARRRNVKNGSGEYPSTQSPISPKPPSIRPVENRTLDMPGLFGF